MESAGEYPRPGAYRYIVTDDHSGLRLDQFLAEASEHLTRGQARRLVDLGGVHLAGRRMRRCSQVVAVGQKVEVFVDRQPAVSWQLDEERILFRDRDLIVIDKPAGMETQPTPARYQGTLYAELQKLLGNPRRRDLQPSIGMVQRLDRDTSGVLAFSIHKRAHKQMTESFRGRAADKVYWALVEGCPAEPEGQFRSLLAKRRSSNLMVSVEKGGKPAETHYRLVQNLGSTSLVEVRLITGRSHQIRAHFSEAGMPLLGDVAYGGKRSVAGFEVGRQMLHSRSLTFPHPVDGGEMSFTAPLPEDFATLKKHLGGA